jgi:hypothetical protein
MNPKAPLLPSPIRRKDVRKNLIARIDAFRRMTGLTDSQVGQRALKDTKFIPRLRSGENFNMVTGGEPSVEEMANGRLNRRL